LDIRADMNLDDELLAWTDIDSPEWKALLLGNGASIAVWRGFAYRDLFQTANLSDDDRAIFDALGTTDFEQVLRALQISGMVCEQAGHAPDTDARYANVRRALADAVHQVHVPWGHIPNATLTKIATALRKFEHVFSTNYDLIPYWSIMAYGDGFKDFFWTNDNRFDPTNVQLFGNATLLYYLHGGLHLVEDLRKVAFKRVAGSQNLLDTFAVDPQEIPLFVSEGSSEQKLRAIRSSDYLWHCYETLRRQAEPLVIFGNSLSAQDAHIAKAISEVPNRAIAVSIFPTDPTAVIDAKIHFMKVLPGVDDLLFFDSRTHPLGEASMRVP
jgi:pterin-4a-carbinolamine dehydratase